MIFSESARWIFSKKSEPRDWYILRKSFFYSQPSTSFIRIASMGEYELYINGELIANGPTRSYCFHCFVDEIDITKYLSVGLNSVVVLSMHLERAGICLELYNSHKEKILSSDSTWKIKKYNAIISDAYSCSPPLEPIRRNEENVDGRVDFGCFDTDFNDTKWIYADEIFFDDVSFEFSVGERQTRDFISPKRLMSLSGLLQIHGFDFRLKNKFRKVNPVSLGHLEIYAAIVLCESSVSTEVYYENCDIYVNGSQCQHYACFHSGENLIVCVSSQAITEPELFFKDMGPVCFKEFSVHGSTARWIVASLETNPYYYAWAAPYNPYEGNKSLQILTAAIHANRYEDLYSLHGLEWNCALMLDTSVRFSHNKYSLCAIANGFHEPALQLEVSECIVPTQILHCSSILRCNNEYTTVQNGSAQIILDFEQEVFGYLTIEILAHSNTVIELECFELIDHHGICRNPLEGCRYLCRDGLQKFTSHFPKGLRYLILTIKNAFAPVQIKTIGVIDASLKVSQRAQFHCNDTLLNEIYKMSVRTVHACMSDTYVDCPGFEQVYWLGDATVAAEVNLLNFAAYDYDYKCLKVVAQSLSDTHCSNYCKNKPGFSLGQRLVAPTYGSFVQGGLPMWSFLWLYQVYHNYLYSGNKAFLHDLFPYVEKMLKNCETLMSERNLFAMEGAWNLIEWSNNDISPCCELTVNSALLCALYALFSSVALDMGNQQLSAEYRQKSECIKSAINKYCWDASSQAYVDTVRDEYGYTLYCHFAEQGKLQKRTFEEFKALTQISEQTNTIVYLCNCVPKDRALSVERIIASICNPDYPHEQHTPIENITYSTSSQKGTAKVGTPFFLYFSFAALAKMKKYDELLAVIRREYGYMLRHSTNTCWESFPCKSLDRLTRSVCHSWGASPAVYLLTEICGIRPITPGFKTFSFNPNICNLICLNATIPTPHGDIVVNIDREKQITNISYPKECTCITLEKPPKGETTYEFS